MPAPTDFYLETLDYDGARNGNRFAFTCGINNEEIGASIERTRTPEVVSDGQAAGYDIIDPQIGLFHEEQSWHRGAGQVLVERRNVDDHRYATSSNVLPFYDGSFSSGYREVEAVIDLNGVGQFVTAENFWGALPIWVDDDVYASIGRFVMKWVESPQTDENSQHYYKWQAIALLAQPIYSLAHFGNRLYAAHQQEGYSFSDENDFTTWTKVDGSNTDLLAHVRNANGSFSLARVADDQIQLASAHPGTDAGWADALPIGEASENFTSLTTSNETVYVGTTRGLYAYDIGLNEFRNLEPDAGVLQDFDRYANVMPRGGILIASRGDESLWEIDDEGNGASYKDLRRLIQFPSYENMTGIIEAITQDSANVFLAMRPGVATRGFPYTFPIDFEVDVGKSARVMVLRNDGSAHTLTRVLSSRIDRILRVNDFITAQHSNLLVLGIDGNSHPFCKMLRIPSDTELPVNSVYKQCAPNGYLTTPWIDYFYPDNKKVLSKISIHVSGIVHDDDGDTTQQVTISYRTEQNTADDDIENEWFILPAIENLDNGYNNIYPQVESLPTGHQTFQRIRFRIDIKNDGNQPIQVNSLVFGSFFAEDDFGTHEFELDFNNSTTEDRSGSVAEVENLFTLQRSHPAGIVNLVPDRNAMPSLWERAQRTNGKLRVRLAIPLLRYLSGGDSGVHGTQPRPVKCRIRLITQDRND